MTSISFMAHVSSDPAPAHGAATGLMAHRLLRDEERMSAATQLLLAAAAAPRTDIASHFPIV
jgi:hypothetical protein